MNYLSLVLLSPFFCSTHIFLFISSSKPDGNVGFIFLPYDISCPYKCAGKNESVFIPKRRGDFYRFRYITARTWLCGQPRPAVEGRRRRGKSRQMGIGEEGEREGAPSGRARFRGKDIIQLSCSPRFLPTTKADFAFYLGELDTARRGTLLDFCSSFFLSPDRSSPSHIRVQQTITKQMGNEARMFRAPD